MFPLFAALMSVSLAAEVCPRGALDARYCDRDGDMVADLPTDPTALADPDTLNFAYTPLEDPSIYPEIWKGFLDHVAKVTGKKVRLFLLQTNAAQLEALRSGRLHVAGINTGSVPVAVNCSGAVPFAMMHGPAGPYGYQMEIIVPASSPVKAVADLKGRTIAFTSPTSNSGYKAPAYILETEFGLKADDYKSQYSGKHDNSILGVANGDYEAAAVASTVTARLATRGTYDPKAIRVIYRSATFPTTGYGYTHNLKPELAAKIREAFMTFSISGDPTLAPEFPDQDNFIAMTYKTDWEIVRRVDAGTSVTYDCK